MMTSSPSKLFCRKKSIDVIPLIDTKKVVVEKPMMRKQPEMMLNSDQLHLSRSNRVSAKLKMARGPSSDLWDLVVDLNWPGVVEHAKRQPRDAEFLEGHYRETPLYLACQYDPPLKAIEAMIKAHPESVRIASTAHRDLPIHIACRYQTKTEILEALLKDYPETATKTTKWGWTPLMTLWDSRVNRGDAKDDGFWEKVMVLLRAIARSRLLNSVHFDAIGFYNNSGYNADTGTHLSSIPSTKQEEDFFFVHAAVSMGGKGCPIEVLVHVMEKYPRQVFQRDQSSHLPLHAAIQKVSWSKHRKRRIKPKEKPILEILLKAYPGSARERIHSDHNRYPLHSALANGHSWSHGIEAIFLAAPETLTVRDSCTGLFPFQLAAIPVEGEFWFGIDNLETVYQLLRARPDVISELQETATQSATTTRYSEKERKRRMLFEEKSSKHIIVDLFPERLFGYTIRY